MDETNQDVLFSPLIINPTPLQPNTDVSKAEELVFIRDDQFNKLRELTTIENIKYIWGFPGAGKSTITKLFLQKIDSVNVSIFYIDCRIFNNPSKLYDKIYNDFAVLYPEILKCKSPEEGISEAVKKLNKQTYLVLDEVDELMSRSGDKRKDLCLHFFLRCTSDNPNGLFKFIFITNKFSFEDDLTPEVLQMISGNKISFGAYEILELTSILKKRAERALKKGCYTEGDLVMISKEIYNEFDGNARDAITLLKLAIKYSTDKLNYHSIELATKDLKDQRIIQDLKGFPRGVCLFLRAIVEWIIKKSEEKGKDIRCFQFSDIKLEYEKLCEEIATNSKSVSWLYVYLNDLIHIKIVGVTILTEEKKKVFELLIDPQRLNAQLAKVM